MSQAPVCPKCGRPKIVGGLCVHGVYHMGHIIPVAKGGTHTDDNIQLLTPRCNSEKHAKMPVAFMREHRPDYILKWARALRSRNL